MSRVKLAYHAPMFSPDREPIPYPLWAVSEGLLQAMGVEPKLHEALKRGAQPLVVVEGATGVYRMVHLGY